MTQKNQQFIEKAVNVSCNTMICSGAICVLTLVVLLFLRIGGGMHVLPETWYSTCGYYIKLAGLITCTLTGVVLLIYITLKIIFKVNDDSDIREQASSPLVRITSKQEKEIIRLLTRVAKRGDGSDGINRAEVASFLAALKHLKIMDDGGDINNLRLWVEKVTELTDADKVHFAEAYRRALDKKGRNRYTQDIKEILR